MFRILFGRSRRGFLFRCLVLCVLAYYYVYFFWHRPIGQGPAGPPVAADSFEEVWSTRPVLLFGVGDSITRGLGADSPERSYFERLFQTPSDDFEEMAGICLREVLPNLSKENIAVSGSTSLDHENYLDRKTEPYSDETFGLVVMTTGGNDIIHNYGRSAPREGAMYGATTAQAEPWIEAFRSRLARLLDKIEYLFPGGCEIYLADIYDPTDGVGDAPSIFLPRWPDGLAIHRAYNGVIHEAAKQRPNVHLVPLYQAFLGHGSHCCQFWRSSYRRADPTYWYFENVEDPNDRGYDAIRRIYLNVIREQTRLR